MFEAINCLYHISISEERVTRSPKKYAPFILDMAIRNGFTKDGFYSVDITINGVDIMLQNMELVESVLVVIKNSHDINLTQRTLSAFDRQIKNKKELESKIIDEEFSFLNDSYNYELEGLIFEANRFLSEVDIDVRENIISIESLNGLSSRFILTGFKIDEFLKPLD